MRIIKNVISTQRIYSKQETMEITNIFRIIYNVFWSEKFWLPANMTWEDLSPSNDEFNYTSGSDLLLAIPLSFLILAIRYSLERFCFRPLGLYLGIKSKASKEIPPIAVLETAYISNGVLKHEQIVCLSKQLDWTERQVERWLRLRRAREKPTTLVKFTESCWRFVYYSGSFTLGAFCVWDKPWAWDMKLLHEGLPHAITDECWWYLLISCAFYWSLLLGHSFNVKRKDFLDMGLHHLMTISMVSLSWVLNKHRYMVLGFFMFDVSDVFLEFTKMAKYAQFTKIASVSFMLMTTVWIATRWIWFPFFVRMTLFDDVPILESFVLYALVNFLLLMAMALNAHWTYFILRVHFHILVHGAANIQDLRSTDEEDLSEDESKHRKEK